MTAATDEYRHVTVTGTFLDESQTLVQAVTDLGAGYWVLTPLRTANGSFVLVNRGFVSQEARNQVARATAQLRDGTNATAARATATVAGTTDAAAGGTSGAASRDAANPAANRTTAGGDAAAQTTVTGLLRMTEPHGALLRHNDAAANHWYSRDVQAIAAARGLTLTHVAPYFIDADAAPQGEVASKAGSAPSVASTPRAGSAPSVASAPGAASAPSVASGVAPATGMPAGGLTVITFHNSHLVYAITWYTLALMVAGAIWIGIRSEPRA